MTGLIPLPSSETFCDIVTSLWFFLEPVALPLLLEHNFFLGIWKDKEQRPKLLDSYYLFSIFRHSMNHTLSL